MKDKKPKIITIILLFMTVILIFAIFYIGYMLTSETESNSPIAPQKTKAQSVNYSKFIALDTSINISPTSSLITSISSTPTLTPTPTEIILVNKNSFLSPTITKSASISASPTIIISQLPQTGFFFNAIVLFGVSAVIMFTSFIF